jgi:predicted 3-demethylubiquinone-9 3-methyltransferase (glyoxalase superfamily)
MPLHEKTSIMFKPKISVNLWFDHQAEEAAAYYVSIFPDSRMVRTTYYSEEGHEVHGMPAGTVLTVEFELAGQRFIALNGGPVFKFNEAISLVIDCADQAEVDRYWHKLSADKKAEQCGWLKDKYGVSWQVVPSKLDDMIADPDQARADRVMHAMLQMKKLDLAELERAYEGA